MQRKIDKYIFQTYSQKPNFSFSSLKQIHGNKIVKIEYDLEEADGFYFDEHQDLKKPICIVTADCMPIFLHGTKGIIFLHAGWRGLAGGILNHKFIKKIGPTNAFIGPCIHSCCYEVDDQFHKHFDEHGQTIIRNENTYFDLVQTAKNWLQDTYPHIDLACSDICTCCDNNYHSFRRNKTDKRNYNIVSIALA